MRIGFDVRPAQGQSAARGIGRYARSLLRALAEEAGTAVQWTVIAWPNRPLPPLDLPPGTDLAVAPVADSSQPLVAALRRTARKGPAMVLHRVLDRRALGRIARGGQLDVMVFPALFERSFFGADGLCCPTVKVCHDLGPHFSGDAYGMGRTYARMYRREVRDLARADAVIAISEAARRDVIDVAGADPARVHVVYQGIDPVFRPAEARQLQAVRGRFQIERPYFLASGGLSRNKNLEAVVDALGLLRRDPGRREQLLVLGAPPEIMHPERPEMVARAEHAGLDVGRDVVFLPHVDDETLAVLYSGSRALVFPSLFEGFGLPPAESMACGSPVIVSNRTSLPEVVGDAGIVIDPTNVSAIADAMARVCEDRDLRDSCIRRGLARAAEFTWRKSAMETLRLLTNLVGVEMCPAATA